MLGIATVKVVAIIIYKREFTMGSLAMTIVVIAILLVPLLKRDFIGAHYLESGGVAMITGVMKEAVPRTASQLAFAVVVKTLVMEEYVIQLYLVVPLAVVIPIDLLEKLELGKLVVIVVAQKFLIQAILLIEKIALVKII